MDQIANYIKPELLVVAVVLYLIGIGVKRTEKVKNKYIPAILGVIGVIICAIYIFATCRCSGAQEIIMAIFTAITQGVLTAGLSTYVNQLMKQSSKTE